MKTIPIKAVSDLPTTCSSSALLALQVLDDSMAPEFNPGHVIVIDASARLVEGSFVLVQSLNTAHEASSETDTDVKPDAQTNEWMIRRWIPINPQQVTLEALNPDWVDECVDRHSIQVHGVVVQRAGRRRKDRVHYR